MTVTDQILAIQDSLRSRAISQSLSPARRQAPRGVGASRVLLADDDAEMRAVLRIRLTKRGYAVTECRDGLDLLNHLGSFLIPAVELPSEHGDFDVIISDIRMPGASGLEVLDGIAGSSALPPVILITAFGDEQTHAQAMRLGAAALFNKPFDLDDLLDCVSTLTQGNVLSRSEGDVGNWKGR